MIHERVKYEAILALSEFGGFIYLLVVVARLILYPISEHIFFLNALSNLFVAQTS